MSRRVSVTFAVFTVILVAASAAAAALLLKSSADGDPPPAGERIVSRAKVSPRLPKYEGVGGWSKLPPPPEPVVTESEAGAEGEATEPYVPSSTVTSTTSGGESGAGGRSHYGITLGK